MWGDRLEPGAVDRFAPQLPAKPGSVAAPVAVEQEPRFAAFFARERGDQLRRLIVSEFVTLDGVMEAPGGEEGHPHSGWVFDFMSQEQERYKLDEVMEAEALLLGRVTYEGFAGAWPQRSGPFADKMNGMSKYVVSTTLENPEWNNTTVMRDVKEVAGVKDEDGGPILVAGSRTLVQGLMEHGLIDEFRLMIFPVVLGSGARLFPETPEKTPLELADTRTFESGVVVQSYNTAASPA